jgi:5-methyltetrahydropteroyltriglutamate--homocysteine methyltransferase
MGSSDREAAMKNSADRIRTSHAGRLPAPASWRDGAGEAALAAYETVKRQVEIGIDCVSDGEFWNGRTFAAYGENLDGVTVRDLKPGEVGSTREDTRERDAFRGLYADMDRVGTLFCVPGEAPAPPIAKKMVATGPLKSKGTAAIAREIATFKAALAKKDATADEAFVCVLAPGWLDHFVYNEYYNGDEEFVYALADALRPEYKAVTDAGLILQLDDPGVVTSWDMLKPEPPLGEYRNYARLRVDALNHALAGIPEDKVRYHFCWGSWHGPHTHDLPLKDIVDIALRAKAQTYSFEAGNVRHEHEWTVWREVKLPPGKMIMPGVVSHATNVVEHPELIAARIRNFAECVGRENVIAGTDCGLGGRLHDEIVWAKLAALVEGARLASRALWGRG